MSGTKNSKIDLIVCEIATKYDLPLATIKYLLGEALKSYYKKEKLIFIGDGFKLDEKYRNIKESSFMKIKDDLISRCIELEKKYQDDAFTAFLDINNIVFLKIENRHENGVSGEGYFTKDIPIGGINKIFAKTSKIFSVRLKFIPVEIIPRSKFYPKKSTIPSYIAKVMSEKLFILHLKSLMLKLSKHFGAPESDLSEEYIESFTISERKWNISIKLKKSLPKDMEKYIYFYYFGFGYITKFK